MTRHELLSRIHHSLEKVNGPILITGQTPPDGDSLGAQLALYEILGQELCSLEDSTSGLPEILIINEAPPSERYHCLPGIERVKSFDGIAAVQCDLGFVLDAGTDRVGKTVALLEQCREIFVIDHHQVCNSHLNHIAWAEPDTSSVSEMLYAFVEHPSWHIHCTPAIATNLYAGMIYDTGLFKYASTSPRTLQIASELLKVGIDFVRIGEYLFLQRSLAAVRLMGAVLNNLHAEMDGKIIWGVITQELLEKTGGTWGDTDGIISEYAFIPGIEVAVLFKELAKDSVKVSLRSRGNINVALIAERLHPDGGGHARAAGCLLSMSLVQAQTISLQEIGNEIRKHTG